MIDSVRIASPDQALYPDCMPRASGMLRLDARHAMHWEECGNAAGVPLLFVHGGPGGGSLPHHRRYYDPATSVVPAARRRPPRSPGTRPRI
jgi:proline iminopeptidase